MGSDDNFNFISVFQSAKLFEGFELFELAFGEFGEDIEKITTVGVNAMMFIIICFQGFVAHVRNRRPGKIKGEVLMIEDNFNRMRMGYFFIKKNFINQRGHDNYRVVNQW